MAWISYPFMAIAVITGSAGLVGSEAARLFAERGWDVVGVDNDMRATFFGAEASTKPMRRRLECELRGYRHHVIDIRDKDGIERLFADIGGSLGAVIHTAAQPSHDWAARDPSVDFSVNATGTLNLLEATRRHAPEVPFIFTSTNKVYGDTPNRLPLVETEKRFTLPTDHPFAARGIDESMSIDQTLHSVFGASKAAADVMVQEYGRYFGMPTVCFRGGCLTGPGHAGAELHGFLAYLARACVEGRPYRVFGHKAKQVRDNLHARDLVEAFWLYVQDPRPGEVYNIGGSTWSNCSMLEAIALAESTARRRLDWSYVDDARVGDHIWWISDVSRFMSHYPTWRVEHDVPSIISEIVDALSEPA
jgi:CDP-paratose 2-epimerase